MSLFSRAEPFCRHEVAAFERFRELYAIAYARARPGRKPTPKHHGTTGHMAPAAERLRSLGQFSESMLEAAHVKDNACRRQFACVSYLLLVICCCSS